MDDTRRLIERARQSAEEAQRVSAESHQLVRTSRELRQWTARVQGRIAGEVDAALSFARDSNHLLALLPSKEFASLTPLLQGVSFSRHEVLQRTKRTVEYLYFPSTGLLSASVTMRNGSAIEIAPIGNEGVAGLTALLGSRVSPHDVVVQIPGYGLRVGVTALQKELQRQGLLRDILTGYLSAWAALSAHQIACNGLHKVDQRCCRRLLSTQDRLRSEVLPLTHDSLALALGVRRASVSEELGVLQKRGTIEYQRGRIKILNRAQLQALACECYEADNEALGRVYDANGTSPSIWPPFS